MNLDIGPILEGWEYEGPERLTVRKIIGRDGREKIQLRIEMGLLQMEVTGRPDGLRPHGYESLLDLYRARAEAHRARYGQAEDFELDTADCAALHAESMQYYHRRISCLALGEYRQAVADADHNLQILDLLRDHAASREDWLVSEQYRAFILSQRTKARALLQLEAGDPKAALREVDAGLQEIEEVFRSYGRADLIENSLELDFLHDLRRAIEAQKPPSLREELQRALAEAVAREEFERAAELRDQLRALGQRE